MTFREPTESVPAANDRRQEAATRVVCEIADGGRDIAVRHVNLNGVTIETSVPLRVGSVHQCKFRFDDRIVSLSARVVESRYKPRGASHTIGLAFRWLGPRDMAAAERLVTAVIGPFYSTRPAFA